MNHPLRYEEAHKSSGLNFPARRNKVVADWRPLYVEPVIGSGERLCVGIVVANQEQGIVVPASGLSKLNCLYGSEADFLIWATETVEEDLQEGLSQSGVKYLQDWVPAFEGFEFGAARPGAANSLEEIAEVGLLQCTSLIDRRDENPHIKGFFTRTALENEVRRLVSLEHSILAPCFQVKRHIKGRPLGVKYGFVGSYLAANFASINPKCIPDGVLTTKSQLWELENLRQNFGDNLFKESLSDFCIFIHTPAEDSEFYKQYPGKKDQVKEAVDRLVFASKAHDIQSLVTSKPQEMSAAIVQRELRPAA